MSPFGTFHVENNNFKDSVANAEKLKTGYGKQTFYGPLLFYSDIRLIGNQWQYKNIKLIDTWKHAMPTNFNYSLKQTLTLRRLTFAAMRKIPSSMWWIPVQITPRATPGKMYALLPWPGWKVLPS